MRKRAAYMGNTSVENRPRFLVAMNVTGQGFSSIQSQYQFWSTPSLRHSNTRVILPLDCTTAMVDT